MEGEIPVSSFASDEQQQHKCCECHQLLASSTNFKARLLHCLHLLCQRCLSAQSLSLADPSIQCNLCKKTGKLSDTGDYELGDDSSLIVGCQMIGCPDMAVAVAICEVCQEALCKGCLDAHQRVTATRNHLLKELPSGSGQSSLLCMIHPKRLVHSLCNCGQFVCDQCTLNYHTGHQQLKLKALTGVTKDELRCIDENAKKKLIELSEIEEKIRQGIDELHFAGDLATEQVAGAVNRLTEILKKRADTVCDSIKEKNEEKRHEYERVMKEILHQRGVSQRASSFAQKILHCANPIAAYRSKNQLAECVNRLDHSSISTATFDQPSPIQIDTSSSELQDAIRSWARLSTGATLNASKNDPSQNEVTSMSVNDAENEATMTEGEPMISVSAAEFRQMKEAMLANERLNWAKTLISRSLAEIERLKKIVKEKEEGAGKKAIERKNAALMESAAHADSVEVPVATEKLSRATIAARLLGVAEHVSMDQPPVDWKDKYEELDRQMRQLKRDFKQQKEESRKNLTKFKRYKRLHQEAEQNLKEKISDGSNEVVPGQPSGVHHQPMDTDGMATSPLDAAQQEGQKRGRLMGQLVAVREPQEEDTGNSSAVEEQPAPATAFAVASVHPYVLRKCRQQPPLSSAKAKKTEEMRGEDSGRSHHLTAARPTLTAKALISGGGRPVGGEGNGENKQQPPTMRMTMETQDGASTVAIASKRVFNCAQCPPNRLVFSSAQRLAQHQKRAHGDHQHWRHRCQQCGLACETNASLKYHMRTHSGEKPFKCGECGREFAMKTHLTQHERLHTGERPHVCHVCQKAFRQKSNLIVHARNHSGETPYSCPHCPKAFKTTSHCRWHQKGCPNRPSATTE